MTSAHVTANERHGAAAGPAEPFPGFTETIATQIREANQQLAVAAALYGRPPMRVEGEAARVRYDIEGVPFEEWLGAIRRTEDTPTPVGGRGIMHPLHTYAVAFAGRAPAGQVAAVDRGKMTIAKMQSNLKAWSAASSAATQAQIRETGRRSIEHARQVDNDMSVRSQQWADLSLGQQEYRNPSTGERVVNRPLVVASHRVSVLVSGRLPILDLTPHTTQTVGLN